ncbi:MAG: HlyD family type I secretion periplasmic adaptor subunit [Magnetococcales bacterium]|nr:HlyD family type I secretion periplasmic adaptor subunit [Magnetococcales bacterium]
MSAQPLNQDEQTIFYEFLPDADAIEQRPLHKGARLTLYLLTGLVFSMLTWSIVSEIDEIVVATGKLTTPHPNLVVQPLERAIIQKINVRIGQVVRKGEELALLDPTLAEADSSELRRRLQSLRAQAERLEAEVNNQSYPVNSHATLDSDQQLQQVIWVEKQANYKARLSQHNEQIARIKAAQQTNRQDQDALNARVHALAEIETIQDKLHKQEYGTKLKLLESQERRLEIDRDLRNARNRELELRKELAATEAERDSFLKDWRQKGMEELVNTQRERDSVEERLKKAEKVSTLVTLTAPEDSVVLEVAHRSVGSVVREAEPLFTLVPINSLLEVEAQIDSKDIGYVKVGDLVRVKLDAFPFQKHGTLSGVVESISQDAFSRSSGGGDPGSGVAAPRSSGSSAFFISRVRLTTTELKENRKHYRLLPGMTSTSEIIVGQRSVISYFLYPLLRVFDESVREPS